MQTIDAAGGEVKTMFKQLAGVMDLTKREEGASNKIRSLLDLWQTGAAYWL